jgi:SAM-dependent methyltransferase
VWSVGGIRPTILSDVRLSSVRLAARLGRGETAYLPVWMGSRRFTPVALFAEHPGGAGVIDTLACDAHDPPFAGGSFALVAALNLLDTTSEPWVLLGQIDALLEPGGLCVLALPYQHDAAAVPATVGLDGPEDLYAVLAGARPPLDYFSYTVLESEEWLPWLVPAGERLVHEYRVHAVIARKHGAPRSGAAAP